MVLVRRRDLTGQLVGPPRVVPRPLGGQRHHRADNRDGCAVVERTATRELVGVAIDQVGERGEQLSALSWWRPPPLVERQLGRVDRGVHVGGAGQRYLGV